MKKVLILIGIGFVIISACLFYLLDKGVSLRMNVLIKPSFFEKPDEVSQAVFQRLFPEFEEKELMIAGINSEAPDSEKILQGLKLRTTVMRIREKRAEMGFISTEQDAASEIGPKKFSLAQFGLADKKYFSLTFIEFSDYDKSMISDCEKEQRLSLECARQLSIKKAWRKLKDGKRAFFLHQYNHFDYFLFIQR